MITVTFDTNLFYDAAEGRDGARDFWMVVDLAKEGQMQLLYTATTDFDIKDQRGEPALRLITQLRMAGILHEDRNAGTQREFMPGGPRLHYVTDEQIDGLVEKIWPNAKLLGFSYDSKRSDACHLFAHQRNGSDIFLTRDGELLSKRQAIKEVLGVTLMSPQELLALNRK